AGVHFHPLDENAVTGDVELERTDDVPAARPGLRVAGRRWAARAHDCPHAQHQLAHAERLHHVIIRADLETDHAIDLFVLRGQHQYGRLQAARLTVPDATANVRAGNVREHQIQQHDVGRERLHGR